MDNFTVVVIIAFVFLLLLCFYFAKRAQVLARKLENTTFQKKSLSSKYGKMTEQFLPFLDRYPYSPQDFRFLGSPVDGVQFAEDKIIFIEFKTAGSQLSGRQREIRALVEQGKVEFAEYRI